MLLYLVCYGAGMFFASSAHYYISGAVIMAAALGLYLCEYRRSGNLLHMRAIFSLFWVGGQGVSCLKLSRLQTDWELRTWACFFVAFAAFWTIYGMTERRVMGRGRRHKKAWRGWKEARQALMQNAGSSDTDSLLLALFLVTGVSLAAFLLEAAVLQYIPFLVRGVPHAYSYFHISGVHYFTVSCVLVPSLAVLLLKGSHAPTGEGAARNESSRGAFGISGRLTPARKRVTIVLTGISLMLPILCVSRFQLIFAVLLAVITYMQVSGQQKLRYLVGAVLCLLPLYIILTIARSHDIAYLNGIFEMKHADTPIFITQPYMYIANNYDNFNCLVKELPRHTFGIRGLFPLWALTGLKFIKPELAAYPIYTTKEELTTVTLFYDAYYDFGIVGVFFFSCLLGGVSAWLSQKVHDSENPLWQLFYAQAVMYLMLSFFTTWYSNPTTWFYFAVTGAVMALTEWNKRRRAVIPIS